jgi:hypothetical protein
MATKLDSFRSRTQPRFLRGGEGPAFAHAALSMDPTVDICFAALRPRELQFVTNRNRRNFLKTKHRRISNRGPERTLAFGNFCAEFTLKQSPACKKESASRDASERGKISLNAQNEKEPS